MGMKSSREYLAARDGLYCRYCGVVPPANWPLNRMVSEHLWPRSRGGSDSYPNRVLACDLCDQHKKSKRPDDPEFVSWVLKRRARIRHLKSRGILPPIQTEGKSDQTYYGTVVG